MFQLYDCKDSGILVNDVVEVVGFLNLRKTFEPMEDGDSECITSLPVIHVIHSTVGQSPFDSMLTLHKGTWVRIRFHHIGFAYLTANIVRYRAYFSKCCVFPGSTLDHVNGYAPR